MSLLRFLLAAPFASSVMATLGGVPRPGRRRSSTCSPVLLTRSPHVSVRSLERQVAAPDPAGPRARRSRGLRWAFADGDQSGLVGDDDRLGAVAESELGEDTGDVGFDGRLGQVKPAGEFGVAQSLGE